jgi:hypothetical protein
MNFRRNLGLELMTTLVLALGVTGCDLGDKQIGDGGTESGDGDGGDGDGDGDGFGPCGEETISSIPSNPYDYFTSPLDAFGGKSVDDILTIVEGNYAGTFAWAPAEGVVQSAHADTESPLTVSASYAGDTVLTEFALAGEWVDDGLLARLCSNTLEFDVALDFVTQDGVFAESLVVRVTALSHVEEGLDNEPSIYHELDLAEHQGSLSLGDFELVDDAQLTGLYLLGSFSETGMTGSLNVEVETMDWVGFGFIAGFDAPRVP